VGIEGVARPRERRVAKFLEARGHVAKALEIARDKDYKFELALQLNDIDAAVAIAEALQSEARWKQLGELALSDGRLALAERALRAAGDLSGMMLIHSATGNRRGMQVRRCGDFFLSGGRCDIVMRPMAPLRGRA
jgi:coatomer subunit beta'